LFATAAASWYSEHGELSVRRFGTQQQEQDSYTRWGWNHAGKEPAATHDPSYYVGARDVDVHGESEADDLWQNMLMYVRTGERGFWDRALAWNRYYNQEFAFRTDGFPFVWDGAGEWPKVARPEIVIPMTGSDATYLGEFRSGRTDTRLAKTHIWGWGLGDMYHLTGNIDSRNALVDLAEIAERTHGWETPGDPDRYPGSNEQRGFARHWLVAIKAWEVTQDARWQTLMDPIWDLFDQCVCWDGTIGPNIGNYWMTDQSGHAKGVRVNQWNWVAQAHGRYHDVTGDPAVAERIVALGNFAATYALDPHDHSAGLAGCSDTCAPDCEYDYTGSYYALDVPNPGDVWHVNPDLPTCTFDKTPTAMSIDAMVRAYRLNGDLGLIRQAKKHWERYQANSGCPITRPTPPEMKQFLNGDGFINAHLYKRNGEASFASLLFYETESLDVALLDLGDNQWVELTPSASTRRIIEVADGCPGVLSSTTQPMGRSFSGIVAGDGKVYYFGGGHGSYPGNDVEVYDADSNTWSQSYDPECCQDQAACGQDCCASIHGGSPCICPSVSGRPLTEHTYNYADFDAKRKRYISDLCSGTWSFDASTASWTLLNAGGAGCVDAAQGLGIYDKAEDRYVFFAGEGAGRQIKSFDPATNGWTAKQALPAGDVFSFEAEGTYDEKNRNHFVISDNHPNGPKRFWRYDLAADTLTEVTGDVDSSFQSSIASGKTSLDWDETNEVIVLLNGDDAGDLQVWVGDAAGQVFTVQPPTSPAPQDTDAARPGWGLFKYDDRYDVFFYLESVNGGGQVGGAPVNPRLWAYRYRVSDFRMGAAAGP
jgi:hypothetical protein